MDYNILKDAQGYYRMFEGNRIDTNQYGDVWLVVDTTVFDSSLTFEYKTILGSQCPTISNPDTMRDVMNPSFVKDKDGQTCFKTGIYNHNMINGKVHYQRDTDTSDTAFEAFMSMANDDLSNVFMSNQFEEEEI